MKEEALRVSGRDKRDRRHCWKYLYVILGFLIHSPALDYDHAQSR